MSYDFSLNLFLNSHPLQSNLECHSPSSCWVILYRCEGFITECFLKTSSFKLTYSYNELHSIKPTGEGAMDKYYIAVYMSLYQKLKYFDIVIVRSNPAFEIPAKSRNFITKSAYSFATSTTTV